MARGLARVIAATVLSAASGCGSSPGPQCVVVVQPAWRFHASYASLQAALDSVRRPGAVLSICPATLTESVRVSQSVELIGSTGTRIVGAEGAPTFLVEGEGEEIVVSLRDVELISPGGAAQPALALRGTAALTADHLRVSSGAGAEPVPSGEQGLIDVEAGSLLLRDSEIELGAAGSASALAARFGATLGVSDSTIRSSSGAAVVAESSTLGLSDVEITGGSGPALRLLGGTAELARLLAEGFSGTALSVSAGTVTLQDSRLRQAGGRGIEAVGSTLELEDVEVSNTSGDGLHSEASALSAAALRVSDASGDGVAVLGGALAVDGLAIESSGANALVASGSSGHVRGLVVSGAGKSGVVAQQARLELSSLTLRGPLRNGLEVTGGELTATDVSIAEYQSRGLVLEADAILGCTRCQLRGGIEGARVGGGSLLRLEASSIDGPLNYGVSVRDASLAFLSDVQIARAGTGLWLQDEYAQLSATRVTVTRSERWGVRLDAGTLSFLSSSATASGQDGLLATSGDVTIGDSTFENNALSGVHLQGSTRAQVGASALQNGEWGLLCDGGAALTQISSVALELFDLTVSGNGTGPVSLINGCQQDQFCTEHPQ
ncbi:MAG TPA: right-handed parallel beta-helix repeat-containing protein [Polyangiaceae bacterium]|nr:right-handed parallel beta-helix repeat-containing protein [Polyangiaceae bacterium]